MIHFAAYNAAETPIAFLKIAPSRGEFDPI